MGQYFIIVNLDKREFFQPRLLKLWEICANNDCRVLPYLLAEPNKDGTVLIEWFTDEEGKIAYREKPTKYFGRWCGDRIVVAGDYGPSGLYDEAQKSYKDITEELIEEFNDFIEVEKLKVGKIIGIRPDLIISREGITRNPKIMAKGEEERE